jgi:hypothetical protein
MLVACHRADEHKTVICIPVYGQSLALGEEAERITDFDSLAEYAGGRIVTENMDHRFGYFENDDMKKFANSGKDVYDFIDFASKKYGIDEDRFYTSGGYEEWCSLTGEDPLSYEI